MPVWQSTLITQEKLEKIVTAIHEYKDDKPSEAHSTIETIRQILYGQLVDKKTSKFSKERLKVIQEQIEWLTECFIVERVLQDPSEGFQGVFEADWEEGEIDYIVDEVLKNFKMWLSKWNKVPITTRNSIRKQKLKRHYYFVKANEAIDALQPASVAAQPAQSVPVQPAQSVPCMETYRSMKKTTT